MNLLPEHQKDFDAMPPELRKLLEDELAAGNGIVEVSHCFPAPPAGAYFKLENPVSTRPRESADGLNFYERNGSSHSGEFTDEKRFYFILEPPLPPPPEENMDEIRAALEARQQAADAERYAAQSRVKERIRKNSNAGATPPVPPGPPTLLDRFRESMEMNFDRWHDGEGFDLSLLRKADPEELLEIEKLLVSRGVSDWRDVEALAALDSPRARVLLAETRRNGRAELAVAVARFAPGLVSDDDRTAIIIAALEETDFYGGLTQTLMEVQTFHPPKVVEALLRGALTRKGSAAHFAAMLMFIHGKADSAFDWSQRPFFLKFNTVDRAERVKLFRELCAKIGVLPEPYLE